MDLNPWHVESVEAFNFYCCPECVYRAKEEHDFQAHALQNHIQSKTLFNEPPKYEVVDAEIEVKVELVEDESLPNDAIDSLEENCEENESLEINQSVSPRKTNKKVHLNKINCDECHKECKSHSALLSHKKIHRTLVKTIC